MARQKKMGIATALGLPITGRIVALQTVLLFLCYFVTPLAVLFVPALWLVAYQQRKELSKQYDVLAVPFDGPLFGTWVLTPKSERKR